MFDNGDQKRYHIKFVEESALPADQDFAFLECDGNVWLAFKHTQLTESALEDAWEAYRTSIAPPSQP